MIIGHNQDYGRNNKGMPYDSEELKSTRRRYILVAAIVTMILQGVREICDGARHKKQIAPF